jgi:rare lipoprotein A (peptidoglycan hydrolase)
LRLLQKVVAAIFLSLILTSVTTGHVSAPIKPVPQNLFKSITIEPVIKEPETLVVPTTKPDITQPEAQVKILSKSTSEVRISDGFILDSNVSWYGPGFYGNRTACGLAYTKTLLGVAHKSLPCGTLVTFRNSDNGRTKTVPVIDRGPYAAGRQWDLSGGLCVALDHCYTGKIYYRIE